MLKFIAKNPAPFIAKVYKDGKVSRWKDAQDLLYEINLALCRHKDTVGEFRKLPNQRIAKQSIEAQWINLNSGIGEECKV